MSKFQLNSNLEDSQWKKLDSHGLLYRIFSQTRNLVYCFQATDLIDLYQEELDFHHFTQRWKRLNLGQFSLFSCTNYNMLRKLEVWNSFLFDRQVPSSTEHLTLANMTHKTRPHIMRPTLSFR